MPLEVTMVKIQVDGKIYEAKPEKNLLETCLAIGLDIPHFCYHPALGSVGACRLCAVKKFRDKDDNKGRLVMSCMEPVTEGLIISINDQEAKAFRASVIEGLMTNHPHDCPVCDEGGECHLQDMTIMTGHNYRRFDFPKRTYNNQELGPFIKHEMNRCIQCYRCVRFYRDYAGGKDLNVFGSRNQVYFGRFKDGNLESPFSGNLIEVCPTGVFTDKTLQKHFTRKWDLTNAPSVCIHCSVGCNTIVSERYGTVRRIMSRYNGAVNGYFLCDKGRFGYEFVNDKKRIRVAKIRHDKSDVLVDADKGILISALHDSFRKEKKIIGIGSPTTSLESNFELSALVRSENFYHGITSEEQDLTRNIINFLQNSSVISPSLKQIEKADAIFIIGEDILKSAPMTGLAVRQAVRNLSNDEAVKKGLPLWNDLPVRLLAQDDKSPVFLANIDKSDLDELAKINYTASYKDISKLGSAVAHILDAKAPVTDGISEYQMELAREIATALKNAKNPLIISGISSRNKAIVYSAINISKSLAGHGSQVMLSMILPECNSMGLGLFAGKSFDDLLLSTENEEIDTLIILENDLYRRFEEQKVDSLFKRSKRVIVLDHTQNRCSESADMVLPAATFAESTGTIVNNEGRAQRYYKALPDNDKIRAGWSWLNELKKIREDNNSESEETFDEVVAAMIAENPVFRKLQNYFHNADFRMLNAKMPRQTIRYSGRTAMNSNIAVSETKLPTDPDSSLAFSMEGQPENPPSSEVPFYWTPGWNSPQAINSYLNEPNGSMKGGDPGVRLIEQTLKTDITSYLNDI